MYHPSFSIEQTKFASISASGAGGDLVSAVAAAAPLAAKRIRVVALFLTGTTAAGTVKFRSGGSTDLTGAMTLAAGGQVIMPFNPAGWFQTVAGEKLDMVLSIAGQVSGCLVYQEV